jgi:hypothetical protein
MKTELWLVAQMDVNLVRLSDCVKEHRKVQSMEFSSAEQSDYNSVLHILCIVAPPCRMRDSTMCNYNQY